MYLIGKTASHLDIFKGSAARAALGAIGISASLSLRRFKAASFCDAMAGSLPFCATIPVT
jgi:hypothetical protein